MGIGFSELIVVLVIILILFGPGKLPEIGKAIGRGIREFKKAQRDLMDGDEPTDPPEKTDNPPASTTTSTPAKDDSTHN
ncbi:MAG: twin-arginine translocase TatA/TatE family subunit [Candidatus Ozemobacteraceae bacterium]